MPTALMIALPPVSRDELAELLVLGGSGGTELGKAFIDRLSEERVSLSEERRLGRQIARHAGPLGGSFHNGERFLELGAIEAERFVELFWLDFRQMLNQRPQCCIEPCPSENEYSAWSEEPELRSSVRKDAENFIREFVSARTWNSYGGTDGDLRFVGDTLLIVQRPEVIAQVDRFIDLVTRAAAGPDLVTEPDMLAEDRRRLDSLRERSLSVGGGAIRVRELVDRFNEAAPVGCGIVMSRQSIEKHGDSVITVPSGRTTLLVALDRIHTVVAPAGDGFAGAWHLVDGGIAFPADPESDPGGVVTLQVFDLSDMIDRARSAAIDAGEPFDPESWQLVLAAAIMVSIATDRWVDNGGQDHIIKYLPGRLVVQAYRRTHVQIAEMLRRQRELWRDAEVTP